MGSVELLAMRIITTKRLLKTTPSGSMGPRRQELVEAAEREDEAVVEVAVGGERMTLLGDVTGTSPSGKDLETSPSGKEKAMRARCSANYPST